MFQRILFPTDGSAASLEAAGAVARLAGAQGRLSVAVVVVIAPLCAEKSDRPTDFIEPHNAWLRREAQAAADRAVAALRASGAICTTKILEGSPVSAVLAKEAASGEYDLLVMSSRGLGRQHDALRYLGSVTEHVIRRVSIPVLVAPVEEENDD